MPPEEILRYLQERPFRPFRIHVSDGTIYEIRHPELLLPGRRSIEIGIPSDPTQPLYDRVVTIALLHVTRLEPIDAAAQTS